MAAIIAAAERVPADQLASDRAQVAELRSAGSRAMAGAQALLLPTTTSQPTIAEVLADNSRLGT